MQTRPKICTPLKPSSTLMPSTLENHNSNQLLLLMQRDITIATINFLTLLVNIEPLGFILINKHSIIFFILKIFQEINILVVIIN